jgi:hypothetical protein
VGSIKIPQSTEETSVTFVGFSGDESRIFRSFTWELISGIDPPEFHGLRGARRPSFGVSLESLVKESLEFKAIVKRPTRVYGANPFGADNFVVIHEVEGFKVYPTSDPRKLKTTWRLRKLINQRMTFLYEGVLRVAQTRQIFSWGFRGLTYEGYRNFLWEKMALSPSEVMGPKVKVKLKTNRHGGSGFLYLWVDGAGEDGSPAIHGDTLREVIAFRSQRIISPDALLRRQIPQNPTGGLVM